MGFVCFVRKKLKKSGLETNLESNLGSCSSLVVQSFEIGEISKNKRSQREKEEEMEGNKRDRRRSKLDLSR